MIGGGAWMNSFPCKQKFRSYPGCSCRATGSPEEFQVKYCYQKCAGHSKVEPIWKWVAYSHPCDMHKEAMQHTEHHTAFPFFSLVEDPVLYSVEMMGSRASSPAPGHWHWGSVCFQTLSLPSSSASWPPAMQGYWLSSEMNSSLILTFLWDP